MIMNGQFLRSLRKHWLCHLLFLSIILTSIVCTWAYFISLCYQKTTQLSIEHIKNSYTYRLRDAIESPESQNIQNILNDAQKLQGIRSVSLGRKAGKEPTLHHPKSSYIKIPIENTNYFLNASIRQAPDLKWKVKRIIDVLLSATLYTLPIYLALFFIASIIRTKKSTYRESRQRDIQNMAQLSAIGEMVGNLAHEINNPLTIMSGYISILNKDLKSGSIDKTRASKCLASMDSTIHRLSSVAQSMLRLARRPQEEPQLQQDLINIVVDVLDLCKDRFQKGKVQIRERLPSEPVFINCHSVEIGQVLLNLMNNAYDAVISSKSTEHWVEISIETSSNKVELAVTDNGAGIKPELQSRLLEPFFTTKPPGQGTGLGLSISKSIASHHDGNLYLDRKCEHTKFVLELPRTKAPTISED